MSTRKSAQDRKLEILGATLDLAFDVGPDHVTTGMIAARLGLTQPAIYKHFPKKEDIWRAVTETLCAQINENTRLGEVEGQSALANIRRLILAHLRLVRQCPALPEIMVTRDPSGNLSETRRRIQEAMGAYRRALERCLEAARAQGHLREGVQVEDGVTLLVGIVQSLVLRLIVTRDPTPLVTDGERLLDLQLALFQSEGPMI